MREADPIGGEAVGYLGGAIATALLLQAFKAVEGDTFDVIYSVQIIASTLLVGLSASRVAQLVPLARDVLRSGYDHNATRSALALEERRRREEADGTRLGANPWLTGGTGLAATAVGFMLMSNRELAELTLDIAETRRIGEEIDAEIQGRDAVRELLADK